MVIIRMTTCSIIDHQYCADHNRFISIRYAVAATSNTTVYVFRCCPCGCLRVAPITGPTECLIAGMQCILCWLLPVNTMPTPLSSSPLLLLLSAWHMTRAWPTLSGRRVRRVRAERHANTFALMSRLAKTRSLTT